MRQIAQISRLLPVQTCDAKSRVAASFANEGRAKHVRRYAAWLRRWLTGSSAFSSLGFACYAVLVFSLATEIINDTVELVNLGRAWSWSTAQCWTQEIASSVGA